jgi:2-oxoglutarate ferredoxin oxidoreductase subunit beta
MTSTDIDTGINGAPVSPRSVPLTRAPLTAADADSSAEVRWRSSRADHSILAAVQAFPPIPQMPREKLVIVSGTDWSARFASCLNTYGIPAIATGISVNRPDLSVWVVTGDGEALSTGGNHLIHALRRNVNLKILLFTDRIDGLTGSPCPPASAYGTATRYAPDGAADPLFDPVSLALGAEATLVARTLDSDRQHLTATLAAAAAHQGSALIEICRHGPVSEDNAHPPLKGPADRDDQVIRLEHGQPIVFAQAATGRSSAARTRGP